MSDAQNILSANNIETDSNDVSLRPNLLDDFIGQEHVKSNLKVFIKAAKVRQEPVDHILFYGPPGVGKTSMAAAVAREMGVNFRSTSGPTIGKAADLAAILTNLQAGDILFIDEIHRLSTVVEEILYPAMEDFFLDIIIGEGPTARSVRIDLPKFTLIGATTRLGLISNPLRDRFGIPLRLNFYTDQELIKVIKRAAGLMNINITPEGAQEIAHRARGTPRIALRLLKRVRDFASIENQGLVNAQIADQALTKLEVDKIGLDSNDHRYLKFIADYYDGGPVGVETIAAGLSEQKDAIEDAIEPYLIQIGMLQRTPRGRILTQKACKHLNFLPKAAHKSQGEFAIE